MAVSPDTASLPYHEPDIVTILILGSFLISLNIVNHVLDGLIYCGLLGQIFLGILWGTPGAGWLDEDAQNFIVNIGYLGLILLVYEGGLSTVFKSLKANLALSVGIALTGIGLPIALSYVLLSLAGATPLQAFAAGAALCSTSLGTTFTVLGTSGLITTRMGIVLSSAAMMDDVVGLVMVQVISNLGATSSSFDSVTVIRPVLVSLAFAIAIPLGARFIVKPLTLWLNAKRAKGIPNRLSLMMATSHFAMVIHSLTLIGLVTGSSYAGTSNLFAAYLAGASISWWDSEVPHPSANPSGHAQRTLTRSQLATSGEAIFHKYYHPALRRVLRPLFFASIGFSIPITRMFTGTVVWKGIVYTILMVPGKLACGVWLVRFPGHWPKQLSWRAFLKQRPAEMVHSANTSGVIPEEVKAKANNGFPSSSSPDHRSVTGNSTEPSFRSDNQLRSQEPQSHSNASNISRRLSPKTSPDHPHNIKAVPKPLSLYPAVIVGSAMTARGEIGFLVSSLAESNGIFQQRSTDASGSRLSDEIFLIVTWAIVLCTIVGPITVGLLVRRMTKLEKGAQDKGHGRPDVLGVWG